MTVGVSGVASVTAVSGTAAVALSPFAPHWALYPRSVQVRKLPPGAPSMIDSLDGDLEKPAWRSVPWSEPFVDIQGKDAPPDAISPANTQFKALYDDTHLYIGAILFPSEFFPTSAHFHERNSPIFQKDSDFEVFIDTMSSNHNYKELEINAINTVWNLMLDKPYWDGGQEHSGRIAQPGDPLYYDVTGQKTAVRVMEGHLNDKENGALWSVEIALAYKDLLAHTEGEDGNTPPKPGTLWRINFSRVELQGKVNWVWQPQQIVWDPEKKEYKGKIDMHLPDSWGYLVFSNEAASGGTETAVATATKRDAAWPARLAAMNVYYAQKYYRQTHGSYTDNMEELAQYLDQTIVEPFDIEIRTEEQNRGSESTFVAVVKGNPDGSIATVTEDRLLKVISPSIISEN